MAAKTKDSKFPKDKGKIRVLVYGTLKNGHSNHILMEQAEADFIGYDSTTGPFELFDLGAIPAVMDAPKQGNRKIRGELYSMGPDGLAALDLLEGHPHLYCRRKIWTDIHKRRAWMYLLVAPNFKHANADIKKAGIWHGSMEENNFWIHNNNKMRLAAAK